jgi:hypothetical protein
MCSIACWCSRWLRALEIARIVCADLLSHRPGRQVYYESSSKGLKPRYLLSDRHCVGR